MIEPSRASLAAKRSIEDHLGAMDQALKGMYSKDISLEEHLRCDEQFHRAIVDAADNPLLSQMMDLIWTPLLETSESPTIQPNTLKSLMTTTNKSTGD